MGAFIGEHRHRLEVGPIRRTLGTSASAYHERRTGRRSARSIDDERLLAKIEEVHERDYPRGSVTRATSRLLRRPAPGQDADDAGAAGQAGQ